MHNITIYIYQVMLVPFCDIFTGDLTTDCGECLLIPQVHIFQLNCAQGTP